VSDYNWVLPRIAVGGFLRDYDLPQLQAEGVGYIVNVSNQPEPSSIQADSNIEILNVQVDDDGQSKQDVFRNQLAPWFMERWFKEPRKRWIFHCGAGVNRGPSAGMLALMLVGLSASAAMKGIITARPITTGGLAYREDAMKVAEELGYLVR
jgi:hypothetical protein